ncbi:MAG TPA: hypothetical protein VJ652_15305 [Noviherbaspirillum sp.]|nr:hypothetical protein [Noviherbaspirillum sp.]
MTTEQHRFRCEVRAVLAMRAKDGQSHAEYLKLVEKSRGKDAADQLRAACLDQWLRGSRGGKDVWL